MGVKINVTGDFKNAISLMDSYSNTDLKAQRILNSIGETLCSELRSVTPVDTGALANSWRYEVTQEEGGYILSIYNDAHSDEVDSLVFMLEYGHGTGTGGYVYPTHFVSKAMQGTYKKIYDMIEVMLKDG